MPNNMRSSTFRPARALVAFLKSSRSARLSSSSRRLSVIASSCSTGCGCKKHVVATSMFRVRPFSQGRRLCLYPIQICSRIRLSAAGSCSNKGSDSCQYKGLGAHLGASGDCGRPAPVEEEITPDDGAQRVFSCAVLQGDVQGLDCVLRDLEIRTGPGSRASASVRRCHSGGVRLQQRCKELIAHLTALRSCMMSTVAAKVMATL